MTTPEDSRSQRERMLAGELYLADDPELTEAALRSQRLQDRFNRSLTDDDAERAEVLHELLGHIGPDSYVRPPFYCDYGEYISIGAGVFANLGLVALDVAPITIGDDSQIGPNVQLLTPTHPLDPEPRRAKLEAADPISIGANVWLGGGAIVLAGVSIGDDSVVGAGAIVTKDVPSGVVVVGNPARVIKTL